MDADSNSMVSLPIEWQLSLPLFDIILIQCSKRVYEKISTFESINDLLVYRLSRLLFKRDPKLAIVNCIYDRYTSESTKYNVIKILISDKFNVDINNLSADNDSVLLLALDREYSSIVDLALNMNVNVNVVNKMTESALSIAFKRKDETMIKRLLDKGVDTNVKLENHYNTPLLTAIQQKMSKEIIDTLTERFIVTADNYELYLSNSSAFSKTKKAFDLYMSKMRAFDGDVVNKLFIKVVGGYGSNKVIDLLINKVDLTQKVTDASGATDNTLLILAVGSYNNNSKLISRLISTGIDVNAKNSKGVTALMGLFDRFVYIGNSKKDELSEILELLLNAGANVNDQDSDGFTALHYLTRHCNTYGRSNPNITKRIKRLITAGANPNVKDRHGMTPLMYLVKCYDGIDVPEMIRVLVENGANVNEKGAVGGTSTALDIVYADNYVINREGQKAIIKMLRSLGA